MENVILQNTLQLKLFFRPADVTNQCAITSECITNMKSNKYQYEI